MKHIYLFIVLFTFFQIHSKAQVGSESSNLPIVIITTDTNPNTGNLYEITDEPKVPATMKIIYHPDGSRNYLSDQNNSDFLNYDGKIGIEIRGSSSQSLPKKAYGLTTLQADGVSNNNVSILNMPKENDWVLNSLAFDASLIRDYLSYDLYRDMGNYSPREHYCEVIVNGDYKGLYIFMEKLKVDENRINITKMAASDVKYPDVTGGYVVKSDKPNGDPIAWVMTSPNGWTVNFIYDNPKPESIVYQQKNYIYNYFMDLQSRTDVDNSSIITGFPDIIDIPTFIDYMIMSEYASNVDAYHYSTYYHKDKMGKLRAGPIWDFNLAYGLDVYGNRSLTNVWQFSNGDNEGPAFWKALFYDSKFHCYLSKRWMELTDNGQLLNKALVYSKIDDIVLLISEAKVRENTRWGTVSNWSNEISKLKTWIAQRMTWMTTQLSNYGSCANVSVPKLVISKINYHPKSDIEDYEDLLEFIEITNNSDKLEDLTGVYFEELGLTYRFPNNSKILPNQKIYLASDSVIFNSYYGINAYGQYFRNLSNKSEKLLLVDAWGNVIDDVTYADSSPWPTEADGEGFYLQLTDVNSDNNLAANWEASGLVLSGSDSIDYGDNIYVYPNPTKGKVYILGYDLHIKFYEIIDLMGRVIKTENSSISNIINLENLPSNIYFIKIHTDSDKVILRKVIKQ